MVKLALGSPKDFDTGKMTTSMEIPLSIISPGVQSSAKFAFPVTFSTPGRVKAILFLGQPNNACTQHSPDCHVLFIRIFRFMIDDVMVAVSWKKREKCPWQSMWKGRWGPETIHLQSGWLWKAGHREQGIWSFLRMGCNPASSDRPSESKALCVTCFSLCSTVWKALSWLIV